ncbi:hypothetical protein ILUMI_26490 [Ignelater luminosus]|uniref:Uncharacterized protein n=1 Tax=Ignelater luminosus TaxID=2038154 RepID=A0A8K0C4B3_IGNLU|nr:hypothetical protein ILUMI_26490 [Ignelater luminosus]
MSKNTKLSMSLRSSKKNFINQSNKENKESNVSENIFLTSSQSSEVVEIETSTQSFSNTSNNGNHNSNVIRNKKRGEISQYLAKKPSKAEKLSKSVLPKKKTKNKKNSSNSLNQITTSTTTTTNSNENSSNQNLLSNNISKSKKKQKNLNIVSSTEQSSQQINKTEFIKSLVYKNKNKSKTCYTTDDLQSFSRESLITDSSDESTKEKNLIRNKRKKINQYGADWSISNSSEEDNLLDSRLSPSTRKAKNREYALSSLNRNEKSSINKSKKKQSTFTISSICKKLQRNMHCYHKAFKDQLKHRNKQLDDTETLNFDMVMRETVHNNCESLYLSDTDEKKLLSSSSSSLPELEVESKTPPRVEEIETLTSDSKTTSINEQLSDIICHSPPGIPKEIRDTQKVSDNEGSVNFHNDSNNKECRADSGNEYNNVSPISSIVLSDLSTSRLIHSWLMNDVRQRDKNEIIKKVGEEMLLSDARVIQFLLRQIIQQPINASLKNLYDILTEVNFILSNYFKERL